MQYSVVFPGGVVDYHFDKSFGLLAQITGERECILITDNTMAEIHGGLFTAYKTIVIPTGEEQKNWQIIERIAEELYNHRAHRKTILLGVGGGVITDITGFIASVYMRGVPFGFVPTSLLAMVDASIGGKNGVNMGNQKNFLGAIQQPEFILYDTSFLNTLPQAEWSNGFAEIIKYACLFDEALFRELGEHTLDYYVENRPALYEVIKKCAGWKNKVVLEDERESGIRKLLNFGHTTGHAFETLYKLPHGHAVALGMLVACIVSEIYAGLSPGVRLQLQSLLAQYLLPVNLSFEPGKVIEVLKMDKKRNGEQVDYILLNKVGNGSIATLPFEAIEQALVSFQHDRNR